MTRLAPRILFVSYGGGHIEMCLPVMKALRHQWPGCEVRLMALTTAFEVAIAAGESALGYRDFCDQPDAALALAYGEQLLPEQLHPTVSREESLAYLGFNFLEWVKVEGEAQAWARWRIYGRHGFLPIEFFRRVLLREMPDVVVTTNAPRSEQAAIEAATALSIPSLSMVDLFALPGDPYRERSVHATRITVLAEPARNGLTSAGIDPSRIFITGNPALDALAQPEALAAGRDWREALGWQNQHVIFWAGHQEPDDAEPACWAHTGLGQAVQDRLIQWVSERSDLCLAVRYHPNDWHNFAPPDAHPRVHWSRPDRDGLLPVLMGSDQVVVQATTVGVQAYSAGKRVVSLSFSPLVQRSGLHYEKLRMAHAAESLDSLVPTLEQGIGMAGRGGSGSSRCLSASNAVAQLIQELALGEVRS